MVDDCPHEVVGRATWRVIRLARFAEKGAWPMRGGLLDQHQSFVTACEFIWQEEERFKKDVPNG